MNGTLRDFLVQSIYQISKKAKIIIISSCILIVGWLAGWLDFSARGAAAPARYDSFVYADTNTEESGESRGNGALYKLAGDDDTHNDEAPFNELLRYISNTTQLLLRRAPQLQCSFSFYEEGAGDEVEGAHCDKNDEEGTML